ncbi:hypothetical protein [Planomonospora parontospora]|nr:hypothetical protein [Planomonospora parontospora]
MTWTAIMSGTRRLVALAALTVPLALAVPALAALAADPAATYTCQRELPAPRVYPPWAHGEGCTASAGAPTREGEVSGPVDVVFQDARYSGQARYRCQTVAVYPEDDSTRLRVLGKSCLPPDQYAQHLAS